MNKLPPFWGLQLNCLKRSLKKYQKLAFKTNYRLLQNAPREHSAVLGTFIKPFVLSIFLMAVLHRFYCTFNHRNVPFER